MPTYTFFNKRTKKEFDDMMSIADMEEYLQKNMRMDEPVKKEKPKVKKKKKVKSSKFFA